MASDDLPKRLCKLAGMPCNLDAVWRRLDSFEQRNDDVIIQASRLLCQVCSEAAPCVVPWADWFTSRRRFPRLRADAKLCVVPSIRLMYRLSECIATWGQCVDCVHVLECALECCTRTCGVPWVVYALNIAALARRVPAAANAGIQLLLSTPDLPTAYAARPLLLLVKGLIAAGDTPITRAREVVDVLIRSGIPHQALPGMIRVAAIVRSQSHHELKTWLRESPADACMAARWLVFLNAETLFCGLPASALCASPHVWAAVLRGHIAADVLPWAMQMMAENFTLSLSESEDACCICLNSAAIDMVQLPCGHDMHAHCVYTWAAFKHAVWEYPCPLCRRSIKLPPAGQAVAGAAD